MISVYILLAGVMVIAATFALLAIIDDYRAGKKQ